MQNTLYIAQLNPITGNIEYNKNKAIEYIKKAISSNADMVIFPEVFLSGNCTSYILKRYPHIYNQIKKAIDEISIISKNISVLIGHIELIDEQLFNSLYYIQNGSIKKSIKLPINSSKTEVIECNNIKYGIFNSLNLSDITPCDCLIYLKSNISRAGFEKKLNENLKNIAEKYEKDIIYINQTGADDEFVYEGSSRIYDKEGNIVSLAQCFNEDVITYKPENKNIVNKLPEWFEFDCEKPFSADYEKDLERTYKEVVFAIKEYFSKNNLKRAVLGLSGGLDSSVSCVLLVDALGCENVLGISMPSKITSQGSKSDAQQLAQNLGITFFETPIKETQDLLNNQFENIFNNINWCNRYEHSYTKDNIQARSRATILWGVANEYPATIPIATSDKSESYMGYATINGDMSGGYAPILDITKTKLFALAKWINKNRLKKDVIPESIIAKPPGAELAINPKTGRALTAEEALMPYEFLDEVIWRIENFNQGIEDMTREKFLFEKKNNLSKEQKLAWLEKFFFRMNTALYKWYISAPAPIVDAHGINKAEIKHPISSQINYKE